jgi:protease-4
MRARKRLPVIASMGGVAASGGYYIASACDTIYAAPTTMTGSIGVFYGKFELSGLMEKLGVHAFHYRRGKRAGFSAWSRPWTPDEREMIRSKVQVAYDQFLDRVVEGREGFERREQVDAIAQGRIWSGSRAKQIGLVDEIGGLQHAIERAAKRAGLGRRYEVVHLPERKRGVLERAVDLLGARASARDALPPAVDRAMEVAAPLIYAEPERAQALLPFAVDMDL